ncbi:ubiquitin carboxyl-terminal hydrolase [Salix suchowensis]|nr:ubiquitin carboxyl-terminal hydrolase [Salix suchowensis]
MFLFHNSHHKIPQIVFDFKTLSYAMEVSSEANVDLPSKTETLDSESFIHAHAFSNLSQIEALNNELHGDLVIPPNSELSCGDQYLIPLSSNSNWFSLASTSMPHSEETLTGTLPPPHIVTPDSRISVYSQSNQDWPGSSVDSDQRLVARCDNENGIIHVDNSETDAPMRVELEKSRLAHGDVEHEEEDPGQFFRCEPYYNPMNHHHWGHFDPESHENHTDLHPPWSKRFRGSQVPQWWNRWDDTENTRNQEYGPPGFMQETEPTGVGAGLFNKGNTCYINSVLQCFTHTVPLVQALRSCNHAMPCRTEGFCALCVIRDHIELSLASSGQILEPLKLVNNLDNISSFFRRYQQEDAHEFLQCLLERLERCCLDSSLTDDNSSSQDKNIVERVFGGCLVSKLRCCNCGHFSDKYEPLIDLSLEIEDAETLQSALESFTNVEKIEDSETKFTCENCKEEVSREKQLMLDQAPSIAALHLKRFKTDGTSVEKIGKHVEFPLELDLKPYINNNDYNDVGFKYQLYAVVVHEGYSPTSGHYFCYIRSSPDTWHKLDDPEVSKEREEFVLSQAAYILFYAREGTPWCSSLIKPQEFCLDPSNSNTSPKSVLDIVNSECISVANKDTLETSVFKDAVEATPNHIPCVREFEEIVSRGETKGISFQITCADMGDVSLPHGVSDGHDGVDEMLCFPPVEEDNCNEGAEKIESYCDLHVPAPPRSPTPDICSGELPEARRCIPGDHLKVENHVNSKRSSKKVTKDSQTAEALRCIKRMPNARGMKLMAALLPKNDKIRPRSSPCKRATPPGSRRKPMRVAVIR